MKKDKDNLQQYRGALKREMRQTQERARNEEQQRLMLENTENIKIDCWESKDKKNNWMFIRLYFKNPLVPNEFIPDMKMILEELFIGHF